MRIIDQIAEKSIDQATIYLTMSEARELKDSLEYLLNDPVGRHEHIPSEDYSRELTICIYDFPDGEATNTVLDKKH